jgi:ribosome biogenesis protein BRX1
MGKPQKRNATTKAQKKAKRARQDHSSDDGGDDHTTHAVAEAVNQDLHAAREAKLEAEEHAMAAAKGKTSDAAPTDGEEGEPEPDKNDPYLLADAAYIQKDTRWRNKQRTLVFASRGVTSRHRHLCEDVRKMLPHHKSEPKFEKSSKLHEINEVCELKSCNNVIFFESRKREDLYMWLGRVPSGPTMKFQVLNIHTTSEVRLAGNCLLGSRPILYFDKHFNELSYLRLTKALITQAFGTPRNHPKSKPFHDHIMCFYWLDRKIWFRHYQISPDTVGDEDNPEKQSLTEIGPRFVLDPIRVLNGSFCGQTLYANAHYMSPTALRVQAKKLLKSPYVKRLEDKKERKKRIEDNELSDDPLDEVFE